MELLIVLVFSLMIWSCYTALMVGALLARVNRLEKLLERRSDRERNHDGERWKYGSDEDSE